MEQEFVVVRTFNNRQEAELARGALRAAGIAATIASDDAGTLRPAMAFANGVQLVVRADEANEAEEILGGEAKRV
jgi:hypothetical protein